MNIKKIVVSMLCILMISGVFFSFADAALPTEQCNLVDTIPAYNRDTTLAGTTNSYFIASFDIVPAGTWDVATGVDYLGWCVEKDVTMVPNVSHWVNLMYSTDAGVTSLPGVLGTANWNAINYILNHKQGFVIEVNVAIWHFMNGYVPLYGFTANEQAMIDGANANPTFVPVAGQIVAVICYGTDTGYQNTIIELKVPIIYGYESAWAVNPNGYPGTVPNTVRRFSTSGFNNWGWSNKITYGEYTFDLWAGAAKEDRTKGTLVGHVAIHYSAGSLTWDVTMHDGFVLGSINVYAGTNPFPIKNGSPTVAPGQYSIQTKTGAIWVIWHANVGIPI